MATFHIDPDKLEQLPTHLALSLKVLMVEYDEADSFRSVHRLIDAVEVLCKTYTVASLGTFLGILEPQDAGSQAQEDFEKIKVMLAAGLRTPSLGIWWSFARDTSDLLRKMYIPHVLPGGNDTLTHKRNPLNKAFNGSENLITFRNRYAHGGTPSPKQCLQDFTAIWAVFEPLVFGAAAQPLREGRLLVCLSDGSVHLARGFELVEIACPIPLIPNHLYFEEGGRYVDIYPLLTFEQVGTQIQFYFYNDLREKYASFLNYPLAVHRQDYEKRAELLSRIPIEVWKRIGNPVYDPFRQHIEALTEVFKGRQAEFKEIAAFLETHEKGFHVFWGAPGVGKSALLARLTQLLGFSKELRKEIYPDVEWPDLEFKTIAYFIRRSAQDTATDLLNVLSQQLNAQYGIRSEAQATIRERQDQLYQQLERISSGLKETQRLLIIVDGLDEAAPDGELIAILPRKTPPKIVIMYGARPQEHLRQRFYEGLDREHRSQQTLTGLSRADIRAVLMEHINKYELQASFVEAILNKSAGNPLYLRLLCQGLEQKIYTLNAVEKLPTSMRELYKGALDHLRTYPNQRGIEFLFLLAAARDFVPVALAAELFGLSRFDFESQMLYPVMEFLFENPFTEEVKDYQLFHESLREFLENEYREDVFHFKVKLADYCYDWSTSEAGDLKWPADARVYAMRYSFSHLYDVLLEHQKNGDTGAHKLRAVQILERIEHEPWRTKNFQVLGNGLALQEAYRIAQQVLMHHAEGEKQYMRVLDYAFRMHHEPAVIYEKQRERLKMKPGTGAARNLEEVAEIAKMGETPREQIMLVLIALWSLPSSTPLPSILKHEMTEWLKTERNVALQKLWDSHPGTDNSTLLV